LRTIDVIIPTLKKTHAFTCIENLRHIQFPINLKLVTKGKTWGEAINIGLSQTDGSNDVVLMDDDVFINENTFTSFLDHYEKADIFGFRLLFPDGTIQHAGGVTDGELVGHIGYRQANSSITKEPYYVCHATTSLIYIKRSVLNLIGGIRKDMPGTQFDDVDFNFRAIKAGLKILQLPNEAVHIESATKKMMPGFQENTNEAFQEIKSMYLSDTEFVSKLKSYPIPMIKVLEVI
jgi:GT2 family glycosyltransferase